MYSTRSGYILGFHGCDKSVADEIIASGADLKRSENLYDWLGHGIYFWENNPVRALAFANEFKKRSTSIKEPAVIGAVICLGYCLDLLDSKNMPLAKMAYDLLKVSSYKSNVPLPRNKPVNDSSVPMLRHLDCAVFEMIHEIIEINKGQPFDSIKGAFWEGTPPYPGAGFNEKNHIQICIRNTNCIKGYFRPKSLNLSYTKV